MTQQVKAQQAESSTGAQTSAAQHQAALATLEGQHQAALSSLSALQAHHSALGAQHVELEKQHEALTRQSEKHKAEWDMSAQSLSTAQTQTSALSAQIIELQRQQAESVTGLNAAKSEHEALNRQHAGLQVHHHSIAQHLCACIAIKPSVCSLPVMHNVWQVICSIVMSHCHTSTDPICSACASDLTLAKQHADTARTACKSQVT